MTETRKPFWAKCRKCNHCWPAAYAPMPITDFARLAKKAACPMCGDTKPVVAKQDDGKLLEPQGQTIASDYMMGG